MLFVIGRGFAEVQILKNSETGAISWNLKIVHSYYYWRGLDRGIAKYHLLSVEAMPRSKT